MVFDAQDAPPAADLYRSENLVVRQVAGEDRSRWIVTFDHYGIGHGFDRPGFGEAWLRSQGISAIHVLGRGDDWYQYADIALALAAVRTATAGATRVVAYGSSMGAYAALRFADAIGATDVAALSPQYSISPEVAPHEERWAQDIGRINWLAHLNGPVRSTARTVLIYDPTGPDRWHGERIRADIAAEAVLLPYTSHPVTTYIHESGLLAPLLMGLLDGTFEPRAFRRVARSYRAKSGLYLGELASAQVPRRLAAALSLAEHALNARPDSLHARVSLAAILTRENRHNEAITVLEGVVRDSSRSLPYVVTLGNALMSANRLTEARVIAEEVLDRTTDVAHLHAWAAHIGWLDDDAPFARRHIRRAARLDPANGQYLRLVADFHFGKPLTNGVRGLKVTPWLRMARWLMRRRFMRQITAGVRL